MIKLVLTAAFLLTAAPALAECPFNAVKDGGFVLTHANPSLSVTYEKTGDGLTETKIYQSGKTVVSIYAHPLLVTKHTAGDQVLELRYSREAADLDRLAEHGNWTSNVDLVVNGRKEAEGTESLEFEQMSQLSIGGCRYDVWKINEILSLLGKKPILDTKYYSPKLNIVLRVTLKAPNGGVLTDTTFDKIALLQK